MSCSTIFIICDPDASGLKKSLMQNIPMMKSPVSRLTAGYWQGACMEI